MNKNLSLVTDFMNPREIQYGISLINKFSLSYREYGGYENAERKVLFLEGKHDRGLPLENEVSILEIESSKDLSNPSILGSLMGLGIERKKVGDIVVAGKKAYVVLRAPMDKYVYGHLKKVGRQGVRVRMYHEEMPLVKKSHKDKKIIVSSNRLDVILSSILNLSRGKVNQRIRRKDVKVDYELETSPNRLVNPGEMISVRKEGRFTIGKQEGTSKKGKKIYTVEKLS